jgi:HEAT repeat protein
MPGDIERIVKLLEGGAPPLQASAALVLGALQPKDPAVRKALAKAVKSKDEGVRLAALEGLAAVDSEAAIPHLAPLLSGDEPGKSCAVRILESLGPAGAKAVQAQIGKSDAGARAAAIEALGSLGGTDALFAGLLDGDLDVVRRTASAFRQRVAAMAPEERAKALRAILEFLASPKVQKAKTPIASCLELVSAIGDGAAAKDVIPYVDRKQPPAVRTAALQALARLPLEGPAARAAGAKVLPLLEESDFNGIVHPALSVLSKVPLGRPEGERVLKLVRSPQAAVRLTALRALGSVPSAAAVEALVEALTGADQGAAEAATAALTSNAAYVPLLVKALGKEADLPRAWKIGNLLRAARGALDKADVRALLSRGLALTDERGATAPVYLEIARSAAPDLLRGELLKKGRKLLVSGKADEAERQLRLLEADDLATPEGLLLLAIARLRAQRLDLGGAGRDRGKALTLFTRLAYREGFPLVKRLAKEAALVTPPGLVYLGFALVERQGPEREAGAELLKLVVKKYGSREAGKIAKQKLKTQGL